MTNALIIATFSGSLFRKLISNIEIDSWFYSSHQFYSNVIWLGIMRYYLFSGLFFFPKSGNWTKAWIIHFAKFHRWNNNIIQYLSQSRIYKLTKTQFSVSHAALSTKSMYFYSLPSKWKQIKKRDAAIPGEVRPYIHSQPSRTNTPEIRLSSWSMHWLPLSKDCRNEADELCRLLITFSESFFISKYWHHLSSYLKT